jgi:DNA-binding CsgD family transcriptional regulator
MFDAFAHESAKFWGAYDPLRPQLAERNTIVCHARRAFAERPTVAKLHSRMGLGGLLEMRMLVCEGPMLLSWIGGWREHPFDARDVWILRRVGRAARRPLRMSRALPAGVAWNGFEVALDALEVEAFVVGAKGHVEFANRLGALRLSSDRATVERELASSLAPRSEERPFDLHPLGLGGAPPLFLAMRSATPTRALEARLAEARTRWGLTPRHVSLVRLLARGDPNKDVATKLGLSVGTVEVYISEILRRAKVESRLQLVAKLWK